MELLTNSKKGMLFDFYFTLLIINRFLFAIYYCD